MKTKLFYNKYFKFILNNKKNFKISILFPLFIFFIYHLFLIKKKKIGIIGLEHSQNIGNNLLKYAIYIKLSELDTIPYIIGMRYHNDNISFIKNNVNYRIIKEHFSEIKKDDYDILMVNSDQTWRNFKSSNVFDYGFLNFSQNWNISKFVYSASLGVNYWKFNDQENQKIKTLIKDFTGISVREKCSVIIVEKNLGVKPIFTLDPTLLIDKRYYLNLIKNYKNEIKLGKNFIFIYSVRHGAQFQELLNQIGDKYTIFFINTHSRNQILKFIYGIYHCKAVITDSFHGTVFSIIFNKPFISIFIKEKVDSRFQTLKEIFNIGNRVFGSISNIDFNMLEIPLKIDKNLFNSLKTKSINYLKKHIKK